MYLTCPYLIVLETFPYELAQVYASIGGISLRDVAIAILTHPWRDDIWKSTMKFSAEKDGEQITAFSLLINEMPGTVCTNNFWCSIFIALLPFTSQFISSSFLV